MNVLTLIFMEILFPKTQITFLFPPFSLLSNLNKFNFTDLEVSNKKLLYVDTRRDTLLNYDELRNHCSQLWCGIAKYASTMIFIRKLMPKAYQMKVPHNRGLYLKFISDQILTTIKSFSFFYI